MSCQDWEFRLAQEEVSAELAAHLEVCPSCRALAQELSANSEAMRSLGEEVMPPVVLPRPSASPWRWAIAAAAMVVVGLGLWRALTPVRIPTPPITVTASLVDPPKAEPALPVIANVRNIRPSRVSRSWHVVRVSETVDDDGDTIAQTLVKKATSDPNVVIYWLIEARKGEVE